MDVDYHEKHYPNMLRVIRQNAGYQQRQVSRYLGHRTPASLCDWENEKRMPGGTNLIKLCVLYGRTPQELYPEYYKLVESNTIKPVSQLSRRV